MLIPKVDAFPATNPQAAQHAMLVYLKNTSGTNAPGSYYWNNPTSAWLPIWSNNSFWSLSGNYGVNASHFIGTINAADVIFRRNTAKAGQLGLFNTAFGVNALMIPGAGNFNTAIGVNALSVSTGAETPNQMPMRWTQMPLDVLVQHAGTRHLFGDLIILRTAMARR